MIRALYTAATGMVAKQLDIDVIANNLANINTTGFKKGRAEFQDLVSLGQRAPGAPSSDSGVVPVGVQVGLGARAAAVQRLYGQGTFQATGNPLDVAIEGEGFFAVTRPDGTTAYTRDGTMKLDAEGRLVTSDGYLIEPNVTIPPGATAVTISANGVISAVLPGEAAPTEVGRLTLARFSNPSGLVAVGRNLFTISPASGEPVVGDPGTDGIGTIAQGILEASNVQLVEEMVAMITAQRAYEAISKVVSTSDDMLAMANQMRR